MTVNKILIQQAKNLTGRAGEDAEEMIRGYKAACFLSTGGDPSRSKVWEVHAKQREKELSAFVGSKRF